MVQQINTWIEKGAPYQEGVQLYDQFGSDSFLKMLFKRQENGFNKTKLLQELRKLLPDSTEEYSFEDQVISAVASVETADRPILYGRTYDAIIIDGHPQHSPSRNADKRRDEVPEVPHKDDSPKILSLSWNIEQNYAELRGLHPYLKITQPGEKLRSIAERIVRLGKRNAELWEEKNRLLEDPEADQDQPEEPTPPVMIDLNLLNRRELIRKSLNKAKNRLKKQGKPNPKTSRLMEQREQELRELDREIALAKEKGASDA